MAENLGSCGNEHSQVSVVRLDVMTTDVVNTIVALEARNVNKIDPACSFAPIMAGLCLTHYKVAMPQATKVMIPIEVWPPIAEHCIELRLSLKFWKIG